MGGSENTEKDSESPTKDSKSPTKDSKSPTKETKTKDCERKTKDPTIIMRRLSLQGNNLSGVKPIKLIARINWLEWADVRETSLTKEQVTDILTYALKRTRLKTLQMSPTPGVDELVKKASWPVIPILEVWN